MSLKAQVLAIPMILLMAGWVDAQDENRPLFLNNRPNEDPSVIDITEIDQQYAKAALDEYAKAIDAARKGDHEGAAAHLLTAIRIEPAFFNARNSLAILYHRMNRYGDAEREYREAQKINPRSIAPLVNLGRLHIEQALARAAENPMASRALLNDALKDLHEAIGIQATSAPVQYLMGVVYFLTSFFEEAEAHFKRALEYSGGRLPLAHLALGDVYVRIQEWDNAVAQLDAYLREVPFGRNLELIRSVRDDAARKAETSSQ